MAKGQIGRLLSMVAKYPIRVTVSIIALLAASAASLLYPQVVESGIDSAISQQATDRLTEIGWLFVVLVVVHAGLVWIRHYLMSWLGERVVADLRVSVVKNMLPLDVDWFASRRSGELVGRLAADVTVIENLVGSQLSLGLRNIVMFIGAFIALLIKDWQLTVIMLAIVPPVVFSAIFFGKLLRKLSKRLQDDLANTNAEIQEAISAITTVQSFVQEPRFANNYQNGIETYFTTAKKLIAWRSTFFSAMAIAGYIGVGIIIFLGGKRVIEGSLKPGELTAFLIYTFMIAGAMGEMASLWGGIQKAKGATERLFDILDSQSSIVDTGDKRPEDPTIELRNVSFSYPSRKDVPILRSVSHQFLPGKRYAVVGESGTGKSTVAKLILRFYESQSGIVLFGKENVQDVALSYLRDNIALVEQEPILFSGTIRDNILFGSRTDEKALQRTVELCQVAKFTNTLPDKLETLVGERGVQLSGGQRQRVAIARAMLKRPKVVILDEATSHLDQVNERNVSQALRELIPDATIIAISHRPSIVELMDESVFIINGEIAAVGPHQELLATSSSYQELMAKYEKQL